MNFSYGIRNRRRRGTAIIELGLIIFPLVILLFGVTIVGIQLGQSVRAAQITRDAASMYVRGIDFSAICKSPAEFALRKLCKIPNSALALHGTVTHH